VTVACEGGARFTGASDSLKAVSGKSTGGTADPPKTPARRNTINIQRRRFTATYPKCWKATPADSGCQTGVRKALWKRFFGRSVDTGYETGIHTMLTMDWLLRQSDLEDLSETNRRRTETYVGDIQIAIGPKCHAGGNGQPLGN